MRHKWITGLGIAALLAVALAGTPAEAASVTKSEPIGGPATKTFKFAIDTDTLDALGHYHYSAGALKTQWVDVPVGIDFVTFVQCRDSDSSIWCGPDTLTVGLETTPHGSLGSDSASATNKYQKADLLWQYKSLVWHEWARGQQHYFWRGFGDSTKQTPDAAAAALDTIDAGATSLKTFAFGDMSGGGTVKANLGRLRFSVCVDAADSVLDGLVRLDCFIMYKTTGDPGRRSYGNLDRYDLESAMDLIRPKQTWGLSEGPLYVGTIQYGGK